MPHYRFDLVRLLAGYFLVACDFGYKRSIEPFGILLKAESPAPVFAQIQSKIIEPLHHKDQLAKLAVAQTDINFANVDIELDIVPHVLGEPLRSHCLQCDHCDMPQFVGRVAFDIFRALFTGFLLGGGRVRQLMRERMCHHLDEQRAIGMLIGEEKLFVVVEIELEGVDGELLVERAVVFLFREGAAVETFLPVLVHRMRVDVIHNYTEGVVPVAFVALEAHMDIIDIQHSVVDDSDKVLLSKGLVFGSLAPLLLHLQPYPLQHTLQHLLGIELVLTLAVVDAKQRVDASDSDGCALVLEAGPGDFDVYSFDVAEAEDERHV